MGLLTVTVGADQPRLDAEFPQRQALVGVKGDQRPRGQDQLLAAGVLQQVGAQLVDHLVLDSLVARAVLRREPHRVLVRRIHPRDRLVRCSSISRASLRASSIGRTSERNTRPNAPSTRLAIVVSTLFSRFIGGDG